MDDKVPAEVLPPQPTGRSCALSLQSLTGKLFAWDTHQQEPVLLSVPGSPDLYLPVFSSPHLLEEAMEKAGAKFQSIKRIYDGPEFYDSIRESSRCRPGGGGLRVIQDLQFLPNGRVRYVELKEN